MKNLIFFFLLVTSTTIFAQKNGSPYLLVSTENAVIPLKASKMDVQIAGTIAHVRITQVYHNQGNEPIEAQYVFPLSTQSAVHAMQMTIGDRVIKAKVFEKRKAQQVYQQAINQGKRAAKLDQERPNVFQMNVGNIMPKDEVAIDIYYTELLVPVNGEYQFVAPGVVGPRYTGESKKTETAFSMPYTAKGIAQTFDFDMKVKLNAGMMIKNVSSNSHKINVSYADTKTAEVFLSKSNQNPANRDFILNYNLRGNEIQSGLLLYEHEDESFFAFLMEPLDQVQLDDIPAREYLFIVDVSGSMNGYPLEVSKELMRNLLGDLRDIDAFNILLFASSSTSFSPTPMQVNESNIEAAIRFLSESRGGGGTNLMSALNKAYDLPRTDLGSARSMVVITDGYISVEKEAFQLIQKNMDQANVFTFGIGSSVNRYLIEGMAKVSNSESFIATSKEEAKSVALDFKEYISTPLMTQIKFKAKGFDMYDIAPVSVSDVFAARPVIIYGKYKGKAEGKLIVTGYQGKKKFKKTYDVAEGSLSTDNKALRYLWARKRIEELDDYNKVFYENVEERVTELGLKYNLVSNYTSFVAVDEKIVNNSEELTTVNQPLPMPQNVENTAIGAEADISEKTHFRKSFKIAFNDKENRSSQEKRAITFWFKATYSKLVKKHLQQNKQLRIRLDATGKIIGIDIFENGEWGFNQEITTEFKTISTQAIDLNKSTSIILSME